MRSGVTLFRQIRGVGEEDFRGDDLFVLVVVCEDVLEDILGLPHRVVLWELSDRPLDVGNSVDERLRVAEGPDS